MGSEHCPIRILVVEDNLPDVMLIGESLREQNIEFELTHYRDGEEALLKLHESRQPFDLIILDLNMPRIGGLEVLERLRREKEFATVPVMVLTSSLAPEEQSDARRLGASRYLKKPADLYEFLSEVGIMVRELMQSSSEIAPK